MFKKAFTLSEILMVMAILGVVATLSIPNLSKSYEENNKVAKLKKIQNDLDLAYQSSVTKYGNYAQWSVSGVNRLPQFAEFLKGRKCGTTAGTNCVPSVTINGANISTDTSFYKIELSDGVSVALKADDTNSKIIAYVLLNGPTGAVTLGKDVFGFDIKYYDGIYPMGFGSDVNSDTNAYSGGTGLNATNWAVFSGNMDYLRCAGDLNWQNKTTCK